MSRTAIRHWVIRALGGIPRDGGRGRGVQPPRPRPPIEVPAELGNVFMRHTEGAEVFRNLVDAFGGGGSGCRGQCACGRQFYNSDGGWDWEDGELEKLAADPACIDIEWGVGFVEFEGTVYVYDCECWRLRAAKIAGFLIGHDREIAQFLTLEKKRKDAEAKASPVVA